MSDLPGYLNLEVGDGVTDEDLQPLLRGLMAMHEHLKSFDWLDPQREFTLYVYQNREELDDFLENAPIRDSEKTETIRWMIDDLEERGYIFFDYVTLSKRAVVFLGSGRFAGSDVGSLVLTASELLYRSRVPVGWEMRPTWLKLGSEKFQANLALSKANLMPYESERLRHQGFIESAKRTRNVLAALESRDDFFDRDNADAHSFLAAELLASTTGPEALARFFERVQFGVSWKRIFQTVFGMSVDEFYGLFDAHLAAGGPSLTVSTSRSTPATASGYSIVTANEEYGYTIDIPEDWVDERELILGGEVQIEVIDLAVGMTLDQYARAVRDWLFPERWYGAEIQQLEVTKFEKGGSRTQEFYLLEYVVAGLSGPCKADVVELIAVGSFLPGPAKGFRVRHGLCDRAKDEWVRKGLNHKLKAIMESFQIVTTPATYYRQFIDVEGITIKASDKVLASSIRNAAEVVNVMMTVLRDDIRECLSERGATMAISPEEELLTTIPELYGLRGGRIDWNTGLATGESGPFLGITERSILHRDHRLAVHEFAHAVQGCLTEDEIREWSGFFDQFRRINRFPGAYGMTHESEFFAEFSVSYLEQTYQSQWRSVDGRYPTRQQLSEDFPEVFAYLKEIYAGYEPDPYEPSIVAPTPTATPIAFEATTPEEEALVAFYISTGGANWRNNTNWLSDEPISTWHGVRMVGGRVTGLHLGGNGLWGEIPPELGNLTELRELWFGDDNDLTGEIPVELSRLTKLEVLDLGYSDMMGVIPAWLGDLRRLRHLYMDNNRFEGEVPTELGNLTDLEVLTIQGNRRLSGPLPETLTNIKNLRWLPFNDTGLCAPGTASFQAWLKGISDWRGSACKP